MRNETLRAKTVLSTKGQVILPKAIRQQRHWEAGTRLMVENTPEGVLLKAEALLPPSKPSDVFGCLKYQGRAKSVEEMSQAIATEVKRRHARGRY